MHGCRRHRDSDHEQLRTGEHDNEGSPQPVRCADKHRVRLEVIAMLAVSFFATTTRKIMDGGTRDPCNPVPTRVDS